MKKDCSNSKENIDQQEFFAQKDDAVKVRDLDTEFHDIIYRECGSIILEGILSPIHHKMMKYRRVSLERAHRIMDSVAELGAIYDAIAAKDGDKSRYLGTGTYRPRIQQYHGGKQSIWD